MTAQLSIDSPITFAKATHQDLELMTAWWKERPHIVEFWDNSPEMWQNCYDYLHGKKDEFDYWIASYNGVPFALVMSSSITEYVTEQTAKGNAQNWFAFIPKEGLIVGFDFMIAEPAYLARGLAPQTLKSFMEFLSSTHPEIFGFYIDPEVDNTKAVKAYSQAGFEIAGTYTRDCGTHKDAPHYAMIRFA